MFLNLSRIAFEEVDSSELAGIKPWPLYRGVFYQDAVAQQEFYSYDRAVLLWDKVLTVEGRISKRIKTQKLDLKTNEATQVSKASGMFWVRMQGVFVSAEPQRIQFGITFSAMQVALKIGTYTGFLETTSSTSDRRFFTADLGSGRYVFDFFGRHAMNESRRAAYQLRYLIGANGDWIDIPLNHFYPE